MKEEHKVVGKTKEKPKPAPVQDDDDLDGSDEEDCSK